MAFSVCENPSGNLNEDVYIETKEGEYDDVKQKRQKVNQNDRTEQVYDRAIANVDISSETQSPYDAMERPNGDVTLDDTYSHMKGDGQNNANNYYDVSDHGANKQTVSEGNTYDTMQQNT